MDKTLVIFVQDNDISTLITCEYILLEQYSYALQLSCLIIMKRVRGKCKEVRTKA